MELLFLSWSGRRSRELLLLQSQQSRSVGHVFRRMSRDEHSDGAAVVDCKSRSEESSPQQAKERQMTKDVGRGGYVDLEQATDLAPNHSRSPMPERKAGVNVNV